MPRVLTIERDETTSLRPRDKVDVCSSKIDLDLPLRQLQVRASHMLAVKGGISLFRKRLIGDELDPRRKSYLGKEPITPRYPS